MTFATSTVSAIVAQTTAATRIVTSVFPRSNLSIRTIFIKQAVASVMPQRTAVWISFQMTETRSENSNSPRERERITVTDAWEPELPPVSINIGIKEVKTTCAANAFSKREMIIPVNVAETMRSSSQGILFL